jgi:hypothetical protein
MYELHLDFKHVLFVRGQIVLLIFLHYHLCDLIQIFQHVIQGEVRLRYFLSSLFMEFFYEILGYLLWFILPLHLVVHIVIIMFDTIMGLSGAVGIGVALPACALTPCVRAVWYLLLSVPPPIFLIQEEVGESGGLDAYFL